MKAEKAREVANYTEKGATKYLEKVFVTVFESMRRQVRDNKVMMIEMGKYLLDRTVTYTKSSLKYKYLTQGKNNSKYYGAVSYPLSNPVDITTKAWNIYSIKKQHVIIDICQMFKGEIWAAGSAVAAMLNMTSSSDIDFFFTCDKNKIMVYIKIIIEYLRKKFNAEFVTSDPRRAPGKTYIQAYANKHLIEVKVFGYRSKLSLQFICKVYSNKSLIIAGFDIPCCKFITDGEKIWTTTDGLLSYQTAINILDPYRSSFSFLFRVDKYAKRGFTNMLVGCRKDKIEAARVRETAFGEETPEFGDGTIINFRGPGKSQISYYQSFADYSFDAANTSSIIHDHLDCVKFPVDFKHFTIKYLLSVTPKLKDYFYSERTVGRLVEWFPDQKDDIEEYYTNMTQRNRLKEVIVVHGKKTEVIKTWEEYERIKKIKARNEERLIKIIKEKIADIVKKEFTQDLHLWHVCTRSRLVGQHRPTPIRPSEWYGDAADDWIKEMDKKYPYELTEEEEDLVKKDLIKEDSTDKGKKEE